MPIVMLDEVAGRQREIGRRNDAGAGHQEDAVREIELPAEERDQLLERALHLHVCVSPVKADPAVANHVQADRQVAEGVRDRRAGCPGPSAQEPS